MIIDLSAREDSGRVGDLCMSLVITCNVDEERSMLGVVAVVV